MKEEKCVCVFGRGVEKGRSGDKGLCGGGSVLESCV